VNNGVDSTSTTNHATFTVGGSLIIGTSGTANTGLVQNYGNASLTVISNLTLVGGGQVNNGVEVGGPAAATLTVGKNLTAGDNSIVLDIDTSVLSVTGNFTLGGTSHFEDYGTMSVHGSFDPGAGDPSNPNIVSGTFNAASGSSVITNTAFWEVLSGGHLDVAASATFHVSNGGTLQVDDSGSVTVEGTFEVFVGGLLDVEAGATFQVATGGTLIVDGRFTVHGPYSLAAGQYDGT
jgi:hypothetical protein